MFMKPTSALLLALLFIIALSTHAQAGTVTGTVSSLIVRQSDGLVYVWVNGTAINKPACATGTYWMIQDEDSEVGKKLFTLLLAAKASGSTIKIIGSDQCTRWSDGEDINYIQFL